MLRCLVALKISLALGGLALITGSDYARSAPHASRAVVIATPGATPIVKAAASRKPEDRAEAPSQQPAVSDIPPLPERAPPAASGKPASAKEPLGPAPPPSNWSEAEIRDAAFECGRLFAGDRFEAKKLPPIRKGACGTPAPVALKYINHVPRVELRPAATINCRMSDALERWLREVVQPRAKTLLDATVIRVVNLAGYDCRPRYGSPNTRISQHAYANAIDLAEFVTAKGEHIRVVEHWNTGDERATFLREIHKGACGIFGTVLGPEANEAHRNHFHLDLMPRRHKAVCE